LSSLPAGSNVIPRDVHYQYAGADPEQVTALNNEGGGTFRSYEFDLAGNQTIRCNGTLTAGVCSGESLHMLYDGKDQLRRVTKKSAGGAVLGSEEYYYDHENRRNLVVRRDAAGTKTEQLWFIGDVEAHYDAAGTFTYSYADLALGTTVARVKRSGAPYELEFLFHGLASNTIASVDQGGTINASMSYAPFGEIIEASDAGAPNGLAAHRRRMNDKFVDEVSDLAYYGYRYYDKTSMTWTQSDPLYRFLPEMAWTEPRRSSLYSMTLNNPTRYIDPDGRFVGEFATALIDAATAVAAPAAIPGAPAAAVGAAVSSASRLVQLGARLTVAGVAVVAAIVIADQFTDGAASKPVDVGPAAGRFIPPTGTGEDKPDESDGVPDEIGPDDEAPTKPIPPPKKDDDFDEDEKTPIRPGPPPDRFPDGTPKEGVPVEGNGVAPTQTPPSGSVQPESGSCGIECVSGIR
jgi:RHS repeat-associated protein